MLNPNTKLPLLDEEGNELVDNHMLDEDMGDDDVEEGEDN